MDEAPASGRRARWGRHRRRTAIAAAAVAVLTGAALTSAAASGETAHPTWSHASAHTATPIKHLVVIFDENISFDHYFGTYPHATNADGTPFQAKKHTPKVDGLSPKLLQHNPNQYNPKRLSPDHALTCDQNHSYGPEQKAYNGGKADKFVEYTEKDTCTGQPILFGEPGLVMDYFDGNTVTAMWNYAQRYAMADHSFDAIFGPSTPGAIDLVSGQTHGVYAVDPVTHEKVSDPFVHSPDANGVGTLISDPDPAFDDCSDRNHTADENLAVMSGKNIGDRLNEAGVTWGWFQGGFKPTGTANGYSVCGATHANIGGNQVVDYTPHHDPFQYYESTSNPKHLPPSSVAAIGHTDQANHNYDLSDFHAALGADNLPAVSFLKAPSYQNGHAGNSDPLDEQRFLASTLNDIQSSKQWKSTAVVIAYDDSDGWYDHVSPPIVNGSADASQDQPMCLAKPAAGGYDDRCGYGARLPMLVLSPYSKRNYVDHTRLDQTSIIRFVEDNWGTKRIGDHSYDGLATPLTGMLDFRHRPDPRPLLLDPGTGAPRH
ncbi:phospholipase C [Actinocatenispora sera]|uniref:Phospholipase C n=1 Tax=Actinocatenispora sera TaxID=390989 RepID=A0A810L6R5_9ACTN|nr:alkaline phosphatase family protein [Actinocatenispora sera]BCJ30322.1 phospholipase C [Actinocatenispora sera]